MHKGFADLKPCHSNSTPVVPFRHGPFQTIQKTARPAIPGTIAAPATLKRIGIVGLDLNSQDGRPDGHDSSQQRSGCECMAVSFHAGATPSFDQPVLLFDRPFSSGDGSYDVAADGRFIMIPAAANHHTHPPVIIVVENWIEELKRLVPVK